MVLMGDYVTSLGRPTGVTSSGVARQGVGPLASASYEKPFKVFTEAAAFGRSEEIKGLPASIYLGKKMSAGTGYSDTYINKEMVQEAERKIKAMQDDMFDPKLLAQMIDGDDDDEEIDDECVPEFIMGNGQQTDRPDRPDKPGRPGTFSFVGEEETDPMDRYTPVLPPVVRDRDLSQSTSNVLPDILSPRTFEAVTVEVEDLPRPSLSKVVGTKPTISPGLREVADMTGVAPCIPRKVPKFKVSSVSPSGKRTVSPDMTIDQDAPGGIPPALSKTITRMSRRKPAVKRRPTGSPRSAKPSKPVEPAMEDIGAFE
jgi:hypothetical protein